MIRRIVTFFSILILTVALTGCDAESEVIPPPIRDGEDVKLQDVWRELQGEMNLDPTHPAWVDWFEWDVGLDGEILRVSWQIVATERGEDAPTTYQVTGDPARWRWVEAAVDPAPGTVLVEGRTLFEVLDRHGFPDAFIQDMERPASYYSVGLRLVRVQDVEDGSLLREQSEWKTVDPDGVRAFTPADARGFEAFGVPALRVYGMVPMPPPERSSPGVRGYKSEEKVYYALPDVELVRWETAAGRVGGESGPVASTPEGGQQWFSLEDLENARREAGVPFRGTLGKLTFTDSASAADLGCDPSEIVVDVPVGTVSTPLVFSPDFLPDDFNITALDAVAVCGDRPISYAIRAHRPAGPGREGVSQDLNIARYAGWVVSTDAARERMSEVTVGGKPAVLIRGLPLTGAPRGDDPYRWKLIVIEDFGVTVFSAEGFSRDELLTLAEGLA